MQEGYIPYYLIPYFEGINSIFIPRTTYKVGVYGTRNVCTHLLKSKLVVKTFVSNMSFAYSGNMGFPMPRNWSFNQFANTTLTHNGESLNVDKIDMNNSDFGVSAFDETTTVCRRFTEEVLDIFKLRGLLTNVELPLGKEITLIDTPIIVTVEANAKYSPLSGNRVITITKNPNGTLTSELESEIINISTSFEFDKDTINSIVTTLTKACLSLPDGAELSIGFEVELTCLVMVFEASTRDFEFEGDTYGISSTIKFKMSDRLCPDYVPQFAKVMEYNFEQAWASFTAIINNLKVSVFGEVDDFLNVNYIVSVVLLGIALVVFKITGIYLPIK